MQDSVQVVDSNNSSTSSNKTNVGNSEEIRQDLIQSAVRFLNDPNVEKSSLEKKVAFLESKGLNSKEIKAAIAQSVNKPTSTSVQSTTTPFDQGLSSNVQQSVIPPQLPPVYYTQPSSSTWKEYLMTSVIFGAVGYSVYGLAQSFLAPLLKWPSEEDLEMERKKMDEQFEQAFQAIESMKKETQNILDKVYTQNTMIEKTLVELSESISTLKAQDNSRMVDVDKLWEEMEAVKKMIPEAFNKSRDSQSSLLSDLQTEIKSLKSLVSRRSGSAPLSASLTLPNTPDSIKTLHDISSPTSFVDQNQEKNDNVQLKSKSETSTPTAVSQPSIPPWQLSFRNKAKAAALNKVENIEDNESTKTVVIDENTVTISPHSLTPQPGSPTKPTAFETSEQVEAYV